jgi:hypothetical protein
MKRPRGRLALELVAMRGKDVVGVRHIHEGGSAWIGNTAETLARVSMRSFGGHAFVVGDVRSGTYTVHVPPHARGRIHSADGIPRLLIGPSRVELREGDRAVVVIGPVQIRAQVVPFEVATRGYRISAGATAWAVVIGALCVAVVALTVQAPAPGTGGEPGTLQRLHDKLFGASDGR